MEQQAAAVYHMTLMTMNAVGNRELSIVELDTSVAAIRFADPTAYTICGLSENLLEQL